MILTLGFLYWRYAEADGYRVESIQTYSLETITKPTFTPVILDPVVPPVKTVLAKNQKGYNPCSCVSYARFKAGFSFASIGKARNLVPNSEGKVGAIIITNESSWGHLAFIIDQTETEWVVSESNYQTCKQTTGRKISKTSKVIIGFYNETIPPNQ